MKRYSVILMETVFYTVEVAAVDGDSAEGEALELWCQSEQPAIDFNGQGEGVKVTAVYEQSR